MNELFELFEMDDLFEEVYRVMVEEMEGLFKDEPDRQKAGFQMGIEATLNLVLNTPYLEKMGYGRVIKD